MEKNKKQPKKYDNKYLSEDVMFDSSLNIRYSDRYNQNFYENDYLYDNNYNYEDGEYDDYYKKANKEIKGHNKHFNSTNYNYNEKTKEYHNYHKVCVKNKKNNASNVQQYHQNSTPVNNQLNLKNKKSHHYDEAQILIEKEKIKIFLEKLNVEIPEQTINHINSLIDATMECLICNDNIDANNEIWQCEKCYTLYHNNCIYDWIFKLNSTKVGKVKVDEYKWTCPHCNNNYKATADNLPLYNCYCERFYEAQKNNDKNFNPKLVPHGCGMMCEKIVCVHVKCTLPCHPGPHLSCTVIETTKCFCTKNVKEISCLNPNKKFTCGEICSKTLNCGKHLCKFQCHEGECENFLKNKKCYECIVDAKNKFYAFLEKLQEKISDHCQQNVFNLAHGLSEYIFHGTLICGDHQEEPNTDNNLQFLIKLLQISGSKLVENIKKFIPICKQMVENSCDCKNKVSKVECYKLKYPDDILNFLGLLDEKEQPIYKCTKVCKSLKNCKIHRCTRVCCELSNKIIKNYSVEDTEAHHLCLLNCDKMLNCGKHICENYCHKGGCKPCQTIIREGSITCECEKTTIAAPYQCGTEVNCKFNCSKPMDCDHSCKLLCHRGNCPPCDEITFKICRCKKNIIYNLNCGDKNVPLCKAHCLEMLPCGVHFCQLECHDHNEEFDINYFCVMQCGRDLKLCKHKCNKRCHGEEDCNENECEILVKIFCKCKTNYKNIKCGEFKKLDVGESKQFLPCIEECSKKERLKKIEQAFDDLLKLSDEKNKIFLNKKSDETKDENGLSIKFIDNKFDYNLINFAKSRIKFIIELETLVEKALKNLGKKHELPKLEKRMFAPCSEYLKTYYNIPVEKIKKAGESWSTLLLGDCSQAVLPKYRLSLIALLFKHHKLTEKNQKHIYHPFQMSIFIQNYRFSVTLDDLEMHILTLSTLSKNDFYVDEIEKGKCYLHFFDLETGKKLFRELKHKPSQFQECYEIYHEFKDELKIDDLYRYLINAEYFNILYYGDEIETEKKRKVSDHKHESSVADSDGFFKVSKGKKPK